MTICLELDAAAFHGLCPVTHLGVVSCEGPDAASFLHNQLSQDIQGLQNQQARLAVFCNAKGRMQASMLVYRESEETFFLVLPLTLLAQTLKRLSMFVLRSKVKLQDRSEHFDIAAALGQSAVSLGLIEGKETPSLAAWNAGAISAQSIGQAASEAGIISRSSFWVKLYPAWGQERFLLIKPKDTRWPLPVLALSELARERFIQSEVLSGVATLDVASFEQFVPQMLNMESVGAVSFKKGCYPGQEVVARSQFRGTLKRRSLLVVSQHALQPGQAIYDLSDPREPCAQVVQVSSMPGTEGFFVAIACFSLPSLLPQEIEWALPKTTEHSSGINQMSQVLWSEHLSALPPVRPPQRLGLLALPYALLEDL